MLKTIFSTLLVIIVLAMGSVVTFAQRPAADAAISDSSSDSTKKPESAQPSFTQGEPQTDISTLFEWKGANPRTAKVGTIKSSAGRKWTTPAKAHFQSGPKAAD